jgi:glutamyl-tRNA reductase
MEMILLGVSHQTAAVNLRERVAFNNGQAGKAAIQLRSCRIMKEALVLSTCNRTELYGVPELALDESFPATESFLASFHQLKTEEISGVLYRRRGLEVARHIYRVASSLDSMFLGEAEILGQVREAYRVAVEHGATGRVLNRLFQDALAVGKRVRAETRISMFPMSVAFAGVKLARQILSGLDDHRVLVLGAGATSEQVVRHLRDRGSPKVRILNRTVKNAQALADLIGGEVLPWEELPAALEWADLVVTSVSTAAPVVTQELVERAMEARGNRTLMLIDLGVPRNVAATAAGILNIHLYDIDHLTEIVQQNKRAREKEIPRAEAIIEEHLENFMRWHSWGGNAFHAHQTAAQPASELNAPAPESLEEDSIVR